MAKGDAQTLERLYIELGLDLSKLQADILAADRTVTENLGRLNREKNIIKLRMEADIASLDRVKDATKILEIREKALNQQLTLTTDRMKILEAAYKQVAANANSTALAVNKAEQAFLKEKIAVGQLQQQLKELASQKPPPASTNNLLSGYQNIKGNVAGKLNELTTAFSQLSGATASADSALTSTLDLIGSVPTTTGKAVAALMSLPIVFKGIENSLVDLIKASASAGDSVYVMSRGFQMSIADTGKFTAMCKTAGVEVNDLASVIKTVQRQIVRSGEDSRAAQALKQYGESAFDASGHLKDLNEMALALSRGLKKAQAEGNGMTFILRAMGKSAGAVSADAITALEDLEGNYALSAKLVKNGLANPTLAHEVQGNLNAMNLQASFMKATFESALLPVANEIIPRMTDRMGKFTTLIKDNKDVILDLGRDVAEVWGSIEKTVDKVNDGLSVLAKLRRDNTVVRDLSTKDLVKKYKDNSAIKHADDLLKVEIDNGDYSTEDRAKLSARSDLYGKELRRAQEEIKDIWKARREEFAKQYKSILEKYKDDKEIKTMTDLLNKLTDEEKALIQNDPSEFFTSLQEKVGALNLELKSLRETAAAVNNEVKEFKSIAADLSPIGQERQAIEQNDSLLEELRKSRKYRENAQAIMDKMGMSNYQQKLYDLQSWLQEQLPREEEQSNEKYLAVMEEYRARSLQIEQERADKLAEIRESITSADKTALEQKLDSIEKEKQAWLQAGMEESEAEQLAQQQKTNYIKGINEQLSAELNSLGQTDLQRKLSQIEQEKQAWIQKGADEEQAERLAQEKIRQAHEETDAKLNEIRQSVAALDNTEFENRLAAIEREKNAWIQAGMEKAEAEALAQQKITKTVNDYAKQRAEAEEQYIAQVQAAREEANRKNQQAIADATNILKSEAEEFAAYLKGGEFALEKLQRQKLIESGVDPKLLEKMTTENYSAYKAAKERTNPLPNFEGPYSPKSVKMPDILMEVPPNFDKVSVSADNAAESLDNLARSAGYKPTEGVDGINDIKAYERPDGSTFITNNPQDLEDDIKNVTSALNDLPTNVKDAVKEISNVEPTQISEVEPTEIPEIDSSVISESVQSLSEMPEAVQAANESLNELPQAVLGVMEQISAIEPQQFTENNFSEIEQSLTQLPTVIQTVSESLSELPTAISGLKENLATEITQLFSPMTETLSEVTVRINDFATSLGDFLQRLTSGGTIAEQRTPVEVTNNISIEEAHAWDYNHIQELAERVAAVLKPEILRAIGGDSNSY